MTDQIKPKIFLWKLDFETKSKNKLPPEIKAVISQSFQIITTRLTAMNQMADISKILITKVENKKVALEIVKDPGTIKKIVGGNGNVKNKKQ